jgi:hypothetical protein
VHILEKLGTIPTANPLSSFPPRQAGRSLQYLWDIWNGEQDPEDVKEFMHDLVFGTAYKQKGH